MRGQWVVVVVLVLVGVCSCALYEREKPFTLDEIREFDSEVFKAAPKPKKSKLSEQGEWAKELIEKSKEIEEEEQQRRTMGEIIEEEVVERKEEKFELTELELLDQEFWVENTEESFNDLMEMIKQKKEEKDGLAWAIEGDLYMTSQSYLVERNFKKAFDLYMEGASITGHPELNTRLGLLYALGHGVKRDTAKSLLHLNSGFNGGSMMAARVLSFLTWKGIGLKGSCLRAAKMMFLVARREAHQLEKAGLRVIRDIVRLRTDNHDALEEEEEIAQYYRFSSTYTGDSNSLVTMALLYLEGIYGVEQNYEEALSLLTQASQQNNAQAKAYLGFMFSRGYGVAENNETAVEYFEEALQIEENAHALIHLGNMYRHGTGVPQDMEKAADLFARAVKKKSPEGQYYLGLAYLNGWGVTPDLQKAIDFLYLSAAHSHSLALFQLGRNYMFGEVKKRSCERAMSAWQQMSETGYMESLLLDAFAYFAEGDYDLAILLYEIGALMGSQVSQSNAAYMYENDYLSEELFGIEEHQDEKAFNFYLMAAKQQCPDAHLRLGDYYYYGKGVEKDYSMSLSLYRFASDNDVAQASFNVGWMHEMGEGIGQDFHLAKRYYDLAVIKEPDAAIPVMFTMGFWSAHYVYQEGWNPVMSFVENSNYFEVPFEWDTIAIALLAIILVLSLGIRLALTLF